MTDKEYEKLVGELSPKSPMWKNCLFAFVIGGGTVYRQMLPLCDTAYITKVHVTPASDTYFPDLDKDPQWKCERILQSGEENGISYEMCRYKRK